MNAPTKRLDEYTDILIEAPVGFVVTLLAWVTKDQADAIEVNATWVFVDARRTVTFRILEGTTIGQYPNMFEDPDDGWFTVIHLKAINVQANRDFRVVG